MLLVGAEPRSKGKIPPDVGADAGVTVGVMRRVTMAEAAQVLGISKEAVRKRIQRGTLRSEMGEDGRRYVYLDAGGDAGGGNDNNVNIFSDPRDELIATLKEQLEAERNAHAETRRIAYTLAQRVPELEAAQEPRDASETASEGEGRGEVPPEPHEPVQRRSWLYRFFFGP